MPIPKNINREHIFQAIIKIEKEGIPPLRHARDYALLYEERQYPCKLVISWGNIYANNEELNSDPKVFNTYMAQNYLIENGFTIINI
jgi:hypothetical protein